MTPQQNIPLISDTPALAAFCAAMAKEVYITVDTEFLRETTYYPKLCLIQVAGAADAALIDPLAKGIDLSPFFNLMSDKNVLKVFHAAKQDIEILVNIANLVPDLPNEMAKEHRANVFFLSGKVDDTAHNNA